MVSKLAALCRLTMAMARCQDVGAICDSLADRSDVEPFEVEETILQSIPYSGIPAAVEAMGEWRRAVGAPTPNTADVTTEPSDVHALGAEVFDQVYGSNADRVRAELERRHPTLEKWIIEFAYGRVMGRRVLSQQDVEVLGVASLLAQNRRPPLNSHIRGALRCGCSSSELLGLISELEIDPSARDFAEQVIADVSPSADSE